MVRGWLTRWQADELLNGRSSFFVGRFELLHLLGAGGMGAVYMARQAGIERIVALKVMAENLLGDDEAVRRFLRETEAAAALNHPHIVTAYDAGQHGKSYYLVMEYVAGRDLHDWRIEAGRLPIAWACECIRQAALGLEHAHQQGLVHRDIKPSNLLVVANDIASPPHVKILDMGIATFASGDRQSQHRLTATGQILGTVEYLAPEQANDTRFADARSDIFSLGCTLLELLTGSIPFPGDSTMSKLYALASKDPLRLADLRPEAPQELSLLIDRMLRRDPAERYQTAGQVADALAPFCIPFCALEFADPGRPVSYSDPSEDTTDAEDTTEFLGHLAQQQRAQQQCATQPGPTPAPTPAPTTVEPPAQDIEAAPSEAPAETDWTPLIASAVTTVAVGLVVWFAVVWLTRPTAWLRVTVNQPEAELCVDQSTVFVSPPLREPVEVRITAGSHTLEVRKPGFEPYLKAFTVRDDEKLDLNVTLTPETQAGDEAPDVVVSTALPGKPTRGQPKPQTPAVAKPNLPASEAARDDVERRAADLVARLGGDLTLIVDGKGRYLPKGSPIPEGSHPIEGISLRGIPISDQELAQFEGLQQITHLLLRGAKLSDDGLASLARLTKLTHLHLDSTPISDAGLLHLRGLEGLNSLDLNGTRITDAGLVHLTRLKKLKRLGLKGSRVTAAGVAVLQQALPNCQIEFP